MSRSLAINFAKVYAHRSIVRRSNIIKYRVRKMCSNVIDTTLPQSLLIENLENKKKATFRFWVLGISFHPTPSNLKQKRDTTFNTKKYKSVITGARIMSLTEIVFAL